MALPEDELRALLGDLESERVERKETASSRDELSQVLRVAGDALDTPVRDEKQLSGTLLAVLRQLDEVRELNITSGMDYTSERREQHTTDYPWWRCNRSPATP